MKQRRVLTFVLAFAHAAIILSLGVQAALDRERLPRAWAQVAPAGPWNRLNGHYLTVSLLAVVDPGAAPRVDVINGRRVSRPAPIALEARGGRLIAHKAPVSRLRLVRAEARDDSPALIDARIDCFLPSNPPGDLMELARRGNLWVEVSVPKQGPPRPLRLGTLQEERIITLMRTE